MPGLEITRKYGLRTRVIQTGRDPFLRDRILDRCLRDQGIDLVCLAGFTSILGRWIVDKWKGRMLNIHPSLLPAHKGLDPHRRVLQAGEDTTGCTVHEVASEFDSGRILAQSRVPVKDDDTAESLAARVLEAEHKLYPQVLKKVALRILNKTQPDQEGNRS